MKKFIITSLLIIVMAVPAMVAAVSDDEAKVLFETKCSFCHSETNATDMSDTEEGWRSTVFRMKDENGCDISSGQAETIIAYLTKFYGRSSTGVKVN
jgi:hypothetical protein